jgi:hypothetical protein
MGETNVRLNVINKRRYPKEHIVVTKATEKRRGCRNR